MVRAAVASILSTVTCFAFVTVVHAQPLVPDIVLLYGKVLTVDGQFSMAEAIAVRGARIRAVGTTSENEKMAGPGTRIIQLGGKTVIPGLIDNHVHFLRSDLWW